MANYVRVSSTRTDDHQIDSPDPRHKAPKKNLTSPQKSTTASDLDGSDDSRVRYEEDEITATNGASTSLFTLPLPKGSAGPKPANFHTDSNIRMIQLPRKISIPCVRNASSTRLSSGRTPSQRKTSHNSTWSANRRTTAHGRASLFWTMKQAKTKYSSHVAKRHSQTNLCSQHVVRQVNWSPSSCGTSLATMRTC